MTGSAGKATGEGKDKSAGKDGAAASGDTAKGSVVLPDGAHHTLIRNVDIGHDRITVDVVQLFLDFHTLTVRDGAVHAIKERQIQPAC